MAHHLDRTRLSEHSPQREEMARGRPKRGTQQAPAASAELARLVPPMARPVMHRLPNSAVRRLAGEDEFPVTNEFERDLRAQRGRGHPLDATVASGLEGALGQGLAGVRVHADETADRLAGSIQARAFTHGQDIYFAHGEYDPHSDSGRHTLVHELAHATDTHDKPASASSGQLVVGAANDPAEARADAVANGMHGAAIAALRRQEEPEEEELQTLRRQEEEEMIQPLRRQEEPEEEEEMIQPLRRQEEEELVQPIRRQEEEEWWIPPSLPPTGSTPTEARETQKGPSRVVASEAQGGVGAGLRAGLPLQVTAEERRGLYSRDYPEEEELQMLRRQEEEEMIQPLRRQEEEEEELQMLRRQEEEEELQMLRREEGSTSEEAWDLAHLATRYSTAMRNLTAALQEVDGQLLDAHRDGVSNFAERVGAPAGNPEINQRVFLQIVGSIPRLGSVTKFLIELGVHVERTSSGAASAQQRLDAVAELREQSGALRANQFLTRTDELDQYEQRKDAAFQARDRGALESLIAEINGETGEARSAASDPDAYAQLSRQFEVELYRRHYGPLASLVETHHLPYLPSDPSPPIVTYGLARIPRPVIARLIGRGGLDVATSAEALGQQWNLRVVRVERRLGVLE